MLCDDPSLVSVPHLIHQSDSNMPLALLLAPLALLLVPLALLLTPLLVLWTLICNICYGLALWSGVSQVFWAVCLYLLFQSFRNKFAAAWIGLMAYGTSRPPLACTRVLRLRRRLILSGAPLSTFSRHLLHRDLCVHCHPRGARHARAMLTASSGS